MSPIISGVANAWFFLLLIVVTVIGYFFVAFIRVAKTQRFNPYRPDSWVTFQSTFKDTKHHLHIDDPAYEAWLHRNKWDGATGVFRLDIDDKYYSNSDLLLIVSPKCTVVRCVVIPQLAMDDNVFILDRRRLEKLVIKLAEIHKQLVKNEEQLFLHKKEN